VGTAAVSSAFMSPVPVPVTAPPVTSRAASVVTTGADGSPLALLRSAVVAPHTWQFRDKHGVWRDSTDAAREAIDAAVRSGAATARYSHVANTYELNLATLIQTNVRASGRPTGTGVQREVRIVDGSRRERLRGVL
jgi:hypothetical protein